MSKPDANKPSVKRGKTIAPPKGTRDAYPADVLRRRYVTQAWRDASIRCGFEEIEGPTFEQADLYAVKSGDGILGELFQAFSGKSPAEVEQVQQTGKAPYALRPEFTPTLARMYAARAKQLPQPCKWFTAGPYFRAEKPQRGRLREFLQWNCDVVGLPGGEGKAEENAYAEDAKERRDAEKKAEMDAEVMVPIANLCSELGLTPIDVQFKWFSRVFAAEIAKLNGVDEDKLEHYFAFYDGAAKRSKEGNKEFCASHGLPLRLATGEIRSGSGESGQLTKDDLPFQGPGRPDFVGLTNRYCEQLDGPWAMHDPSIVRGLAYYTGTVFEVIADGERAVAGGGRYDNLIELFGGPPTPACGFGMGDVVLSNLLDDKGLFPEGKELMDAVSRPGASVRPEAFVIHNGSDESRELVRPLVAALRRGIESENYLDRDGRKPWDADRYCVGGNGCRPMHARQSYKATGNMGKLKADGVKQHARFVVEVHEANKVELRDLDRNEPITSSMGSWSVDPSSEVYVGRGLIEAMG